MVVERNKGMNGKEKMKEEGGKEKKNMWSKAEAATKSYEQQVQQECSY